MSRIVSIQEFDPTPPLSSNDFPLPDLFPHFLLSAGFSFHLFFLSSCARIPASPLAEAWPLLLRFLAIPPRPEQTWTVPRWARMRLAGLHSGAGCGWMDVWVLVWGGCWHALQSLLFLLLMFCSACSDPQCFLQSPFPRCWSACVAENVPPPSFP